MPLPLSICMESTSYVVSFRIVLFYLVTTGWISYISLICEDSINQFNELNRCVNYPYSRRSGARHCESSRDNIITTTE